MADKTSIKSLAEEIVQVGAYESLKPDYVGLEDDDDYFFDGWNKLKTEVTYSDNFVDDEIIKIQPSANQQFKHFWHCVFDDPVEFVGYWANKIFLNIIAILRVTFILTIGVYPVLLLMSIYLKSDDPREAADLAALLVWALIVSLIMAIMMYIMGSSNFVEKTFKVKAGGPLWLTIWHREAGSWVAYDFRFYCYDGHPLDQLLGDGVALLSDYSKNELDMAYAHLNYLERFLILPDTAEHQLLSEPLSAKDEIDLKHATKQGQIRQELHDRLLQQVMAFNKKEA